MRVESVCCVQYYHIYTMYTHLHPPPPPTVWTRYVSGLPPHPLVLVDYEVAADIMGRGEGQETGGSDGRRENLK
jgi:hypothetical protein